MRRLILLVLAFILFGNDYWALPPRNMPPTIKDIPSPIVGGSGPVTQANRFVYSDAIDLDLFVTDKETSNPAQLKWSYEVIGTPKYRINNVQPISSTDSVSIMVNPGSKRINGTILDPQDGDNKSNTITVRNVHLSPIGGPEQNQGSTTGILTGETQLITLYASDGTTYSTKEVFFYTANSEPDHLSHGCLSKILSFDGTQEGWLFGTGFTRGTITSGTKNNTALCMSVPLAGNNIGCWYSPLNLFTPAAYSVYHIRATMNGSNATAGKTPFWDIAIDNTYDGRSGYNLFGCDAYFLDNAGGANAVIDKAGGRDFHIVWTPAAVLTPQFNNPSTGVFSPQKIPNLRCRIIFRVMDAGITSAFTANLDEGTICLTNLTIERYDISALEVVKPASEIYQVTHLDPTTSATSGTTLADTRGSTIEFKDGMVTITPTAATAKSEICVLTPGTNMQYDLNTPATIADNFPVPWVSDTLYQFTAELSAPDAAGEANPFDIISLAIDSPTNEVNMESIVTNMADRCASPKVSEQPQTYTAFFWTQKRTASDQSQYYYLRPRLAFMNRPDPGVGNNTGGVRVHSIKVQEVKFPDIGRSSSGLTLCGCF